MSSQLDTGVDSTLFKSTDGLTNGLGKSCVDTPSGTPQSLNSSSPQSQQSTSTAYNSPFSSTFTSQSSQSAASPPAPFTVNIEYMQQLLKDRHRLSELAISPGFHHLERLLDSEVSRVRSVLFHNKEDHAPLVLPPPEGEIITKTEKVFVPVEDYPEFNFVGRILGPRGMTAKQLETETGCKIMVRGRGSIRDKKKEELNRGKPNWEHLDEKLHVLISVQDTENRANIKLERAIQEVQALLVPINEGEDELKKRQLMELAIMNGTYRDVNSRQSSASAVNNSSPLVASVMPQITPFDEHHHLSMLAASGLNHPLNPYRTLTSSPAAQVGAPLILAPNGRQYQAHPIAAAGLISGPASQHHLHLNLAQQAATAAGQPSPSLIDGSLLYSAGHPAVHPHHPLTPYDFHPAQYATFAALSNNVAVASAPHGIASQQQDGFSVEKRKTPGTATAASTVVHGVHHGRTVGSTISPSIGTSCRNIFPDNFFTALMSYEITVLYCTPNQTLEECPIERKTKPGANILGVVMFAVIMGVVVSRVESRAFMLELFRGMNDIFMEMTVLAINIMPFCVIFLIMPRIITVGDLSVLFGSVGWYSATVLIGLFIHCTVLLPLMYFVFIRRNPYFMFKQLAPALIMGFGTSSSSVTMPITIKCLEDRVGLDKRIVRFCIPIGTTINMDGTALYEAVAAIFISQYREIPLSFAQIFVVALTATAAAIGAAGIPQAGLVTMIIVLNAVNLPPQDAALIILVDWALDRCRTVCNILGDCYATSIVDDMCKNDIQGLDIKANDSKGTLGEDNHGNDFKCDPKPPMPSPAQPALLKFYAKSSDMKPYIKKRTPSSANDATTNIKSTTTITPDKKKVTPAVSTTSKKKKNEQFRIIFPVPDTKRKDSKAKFDGKDQSKNV